MTTEDKRVIEGWLRDQRGYTESLRADASDPLTPVIFSSRLPVMESRLAALTRVLEEAERERVSVECTRNTTGGEGCISFRKYPAAIFAEDFPDPICGMINEAPRGTRFRITCERLPKSEGKDEQ